MFKLIYNFIILFGLLMMTNTVAYGALLVDNVTLPGSDFPLVSTSVSIPIPQFNPSLGTLESVNYSINFQNTLFEAITENNYNPSITLTFTAAISFTDSSNQTASFPNVTDSGTLGSNVWNVDIPEITSQSHSETSSNIANIAAYIGTGNLEGNFNFDGGVTASSINVSLDFPYVVVSGFTVNYTYIPAVAVPDPATWATLGAFLMISLMFAKNHRIGLMQNR